MPKGHYKYISAVSSAFVSLATIELVCDDSRNTMLMMVQSLSRYSLEGEDQRRHEEVCKMLWKLPLGHRDDEVRVSDVWDERGKEELVV